MKNKSDSLITVLTASLIHEIHIAKSILASNNISSYIFDENIMSTIGTAYVDGYKLEVASEDYEKALKILEEVNSEDS